MTDSRLDARTGDELHEIYPLIAEQHSDLEIDGHLAPILVHDPLGSTIAPQAIYKTLVISTTINPVMLALDRDPTRLGARIVAVDQDVVLCNTKELAQAAANTVASVPYPTGFYLPKGLNMVISNQDQCWLAAINSTPNRVSVVIERA